MTDLINIQLDYLIKYPPKSINLKEIPATLNSSISLSLLEQPSIKAKTKAASL